MSVRPWLFPILLIAIASPAPAHVGSVDYAGSFIAGFTHPLLGVDHIVAMFAIGIWAASLSPRAMWLVPLSFVMAMAGGFALGAAGLRIPGVEAGIASSVLVLGILIAAAIRPGIVVGMLLAGLFAIFHGQAHGAEMSGYALAFSFGFAVATSLLHLAGMGIGSVLARPRLLLARAIGGSVACFGVALMGGLL